MAAKKLTLNKWFHNDEGTEATLTETIELELQDVNPDDQHSAYYCTGPRQEFYEVWVPKEESLQPLTFDTPNLLCLLEVLTDAINNDWFDAPEDRSHAEELLHRIKKHLAVPRA